MKNGKTKILFSDFRKSIDSYIIIKYHINCSGP